MSIMVQQKTTIARKYIMVPEFKPLFAMAKCFGPTKGPLEKPTPATLPVIEALLKQSGRDAVTVMETVKSSDGKGWRSPVQLTLDNFTLSYEEIASGKKVESVIKKEIVKVNSRAVAPTPVEKEGAPKGVVRELNDAVRTGDKIEIEVPAPVKTTAVKTPADKIPEPDVEINLGNENEKIKADLGIVPDIVANATEVLTEETDKAIADELPAEEVEQMSTEEDASEAAAETEVQTTEEGKPLTRAERKALRRAQREAESK